MIFVEHILKPARRAEGYGVTELCVVDKNTYSTIFMLKYGENRVHRLRYREKREGERRELYIKEMCPLLPAPLASGQLYIYMQ
jgi:pimeloyl-CoA synthetase